MLRFTVVLVEGKEPVMTSRRLFRLIAAALVALQPIAAAAQTPTDLDAKARAIHQHILVIDSHTDVLLPGSPENLYAPGHTSHTDLDKLKKGGVGGVAMAIAVGNGPRTAEGVAAARAEANAKLAAIRVLLTDHPDQVALALRADDVVRIHKAGKVAVIESFLNTRSIGSDLSAIDGFYHDGVRLFGFTHAGNNDFADSSRPSGEPAEEHRGLSPIGKQAVAKLNRLGVIIDISQLTPAGVMQVLELSKAPVIASHSNVRALVDNTRTLSDRELDAIKANGGIVDVTPFNNYLRRVPPDLDAPARARLPRATVSDLVDHIDYIVKRIGIDHVGIGTDFNHGAGIEGFDDESEARTSRASSCGAATPKRRSQRSGAGTSCVSSGASRPSRQKCGRRGPSALRANLSPVHDAASAGIERVAAVHRAAVVPQHQVAWPPVVPPRQPVIGRVLPDLIQQRVGLLERQAVDVGVAPAPEVQAAAAGFRVDANEGMQGARRGPRIIGRRHARADISAAVIGAVVLDLQTLDSLFQGRRQCLPRAMHRAEHRVAAGVRHFERVERARLRRIGQV